mgnify:CR=1 FL=1
MDLNLKRVLALIQKDVENNWTELDWEFEQRPEEVVVSTSISLKNIKGGKIKKSSFPAQFYHLKNFFNSLNSSRVFQFLQS